MYSYSICYYILIYLVYYYVLGIMLLNIILFIGIHVEKAHLLTTIINNIEMQSNYYQKASLNYVVKQSDPLFSLFEEKGNTLNINNLFLNFFHFTISQN